MDTDVLLIIPFIGEMDESEFLCFFLYDTCVSLTSLF